MNSTLNIRRKILKIFLKATKSLIKERKLFDNTLMQKNSKQNIPFLEFINWEH